jgi:hypothetical protein
MKLLLIILICLTLTGCVATGLDESTIPTTSTAPALPDSNPTVALESTPPATITGQATPTPIFEMPVPLSGAELQLPIAYDTTQIEQVQSRTITIGGVDYLANFYRNNAYTCGDGEGKYTFLTFEQAATATQEKPLWTILHGDGIGYFDETGTYTGGFESHNSEEDALFLLRSVIARHAFRENALTASGADAFKETVVGHRLQDDYRLMASSLCDHDVVSGVGNPYPFNPYDDTVDGALATMASVAYVATHMPTSYVWLHGTSAGAIGVHSVATLFALNGVTLTGVLPDSSLMSTNRLTFFESSACTTSQEDNPNFNIDLVREKIGPFFQDEALLLENRIGLPETPPYFVIQGGLDRHCCGDQPVIVEAGLDGYTNNCAWAQDPVLQALQQHPDPLTRTLVVLELGHVISEDEGEHQAQLEQWVADILATSPTPPTFD